MSLADHDIEGGSGLRIAFVGLDAAGRARLAALAASGAAEVAALCDPDPERLCAAAPGHRRADCFDDPAELLDAAGELEVDGVVVAASPADSIELTVAALERGLAVLAPTSLASDAVSCRRAVTAARRADRLLAVDYPYRALPGVARAVRRAGAGVLGPVMHVRGALHAQPGSEEAGGPVPAGAFAALGVHLLDLTLALLGRPEVESVTARCFRDGRTLTPPADGAEDFAAARFEFAGGPSADLTVSRSPHAGAVRAFQLEAFGTRGGLELLGPGGGADGFELAVRERGRRTVVARAGGEARGASAIAWARRLSRSPHFDPAVAGSVAVAETVERVYERRSSGLRESRRPELPRSSEPVDAAAVVPA